MSEHHQHPTTSVTQAQDISPQALDPVCGMTVVPQRAAATRDYAGHTYSFCSPSCAETFQADPSRYLGRPPAATHAHRPHVCGMHVSPEHAAGIVEHGGHIYYFCSKTCQEKFQAAPARYAPAGRIPVPHLAAAHDDASGVYVCPMNPDVRQQGPGACPRCGCCSPCCRDGSWCGSNLSWQPRVVKLRHFW